ncbi:MFS transporter [Pusillimonas noertemannii]|uniref:Putative MFS family arabinose efflux permease n=1 Tax=Pusillimonas noertemannii TaxID=305977 RepID=A0A2U1CIA2_9BURK|nr:MFS transporter [Pusillimonas noertemannii]PVY60652.1 putative MFS family arabinose efflux permease [Pusillimonas noertemannii]
MNSTSAPGNNRSYFWVCVSMCVGVMGTALASPLYPLYQEAWNLAPSQIAQLYTAYMIAALATLLFLGRLTDRHGFLPVLRGGVILVTVGITISALAWDAASFTFSRILIGLASGLIVTSSSLGLGQLRKGGNSQRVAATISLTLAFGFGLGPVVGGLIAQWTPYPLVSAYVPSIVLGLLAVYALFRQDIKPAPQLAPDASGWRSWLPALSLPAPPLTRPYLIGSLAAFSAFGMFSLYASLAPSFMDRMVPWHGPAVSGLSIGIILFLSAAFQFVARPWVTKRVVIWGLLGLLLANVLLMLNTLTTSPLLFASSVLTTAFGHGLCNLGGISIVNKVAPPHQRSSLLSTYLMTAYLGSILPVLGMGWLADHIGLSNALLVFCTCIAVLTGCLAFAALRTPVIAAPEG